MNRLLEIACFNEESAIAAINAGAHRIELCEDYLSGGITPKEETIKRIRKQTSIPIHVIVRPRPGNFLYSESEIKSMKQTISFCKEHKIDGLVFGILNRENKIDKEKCIELLNISKGMCCTFHRAIDACKDLNEGIESLIDLGFQKVLTSGGAASVIEGLSELKALQKKYGKNITIIPGGGIRANNLSEIITETGCSEFHSAAIPKGFSNPSVKEIQEMLAIVGKS